MILMTYLRLKASMETAEVAALADLPQNLVSFAEHKGLILTDDQTVAIARALGYAGTPADLYDEVDPSKAAGLDDGPFTPVARGKLDSE